MRTPVMVCLIVAGCAHDGAARADRDRTLLGHSLPVEFGDGARLELVEVAYAPGGASEPHRHGCPVAVYVVAGAVRAQLRGGTETVYRAGQAFYESPGDVHLVSANASTDAEARFVAFFVCRSDAPLSMPWSPSPGGTP
ncbi:MAG: cupin domain-containing protein [Kofleriaceae bacterium]